MALPVRVLPTNLGRRHVIDQEVSLRDEWDVLGELANGEAAPRIPEVVKPVQRDTGNRRHAHAQQFRLGWAGLPHHASCATC